MRPLYRSVAFLIISVLACGAWVWSYSAGTLSRSADALMHLEVSRGHFSGAVLVSRGGKVLYEKAFGLANAEWHIPNTTRTKFEIGSITKPFTAILVMQLEDEGRLALNDSICAYLTPCPPEWRPVTLHHLLSHVSGIFNVTSAPDFAVQRSVPQTHDQIVARFRNVPLAFTPGTEFQYSNSNYYLLGLVIEKVTQRPYATVLRERILEPLRMRDTGMVARDELLEERANGYEVNAEGRLENNPKPMEPTWSFAAGGMYSTVEDLQKWSDALATGALVSREVLERMWQPVEGGYGYGWQILQVGSDILNRSAIGHGGREPGFAAFFSRLLEDQLTVVVLSNNISSNPQRVVRGLNAIALGEHYESSLTREPGLVSQSVLQRYAGEYQLEDKVWVVTARNGRLFARYQTFPEIEILPDTDTTFFFRELDGGLKMVEDGRGHVTGFVLSPSGQVATRVR